MKKILMIATGGTIASVQTDVGLAPGLSAEELLTAAPRISKWCEVEVVQPYSIDSTSVTVAHWQQLVKVLEDNYEKSLSKGEYEYLDHVNSHLSVQE